MERHLVVIGGNAGGMSAAVRARRGDPSLPITVFERSGHISYGSCGLPYYIGDDIKEIDRLIIYTPEYMKKERNINVHTFCEVTKIDVSNKCVVVKDLKTGKVFKQHYSHLVIGTGASPIIPPIPGIENDNIFTLRNIEDGKRIKYHVISNKPKKAAVLGAGFIGLETAEALRKWGVDVYIFESFSEILPQLDRELVSVVEGELEKNGVKLFKNTEVKVFEHTGDGGIRVNTGAGSSFDVDMAVVCTGVRPNTDLAKDAGIETGIKGSIKVDKYMRTSAPNVWAAGDCCETYDIITKMPLYIPLGTTANKQGKIAGENLIGGKAVFPGVLGTQVAKVFDTFVAFTGLNESRAAEAGIETLSVKIKALDKASYYPGAKPIYIKIVMDKNTGRVLGAQLAGSEGVAKRVDVFATAITAGMTVYDLYQLDLAYAPPVAPSSDPVLIAASAGIKAMKGKNIIN